MGHGQSCTRRSRRHRSYWMYVHARTAGDPDGAAADRSARRSARSIRGCRWAARMPMTALSPKPSADPRFSAVTISTFALGGAPARLDRALRVVSFGVVRRRREIAIQPRARRLAVQREAQVIRARGRCRPVASPSACSVPCGWAG